ncbi:MAG: AbrB/MazE/SpoVT family DNA-binding domain-containing protein [Balneolales bacterium]
MIIKVQKIGNSLGIILPKQIVEAFHLEEDDTLVIEEKEEGIFMNLQDPDFAQWVKAYRKANSDYKDVLQELAK